MISFSNNKSTLPTGSTFMLRLPTTKEELSLPSLRKILHSELQISASHFLKHFSSKVHLFVSSSLCLSVGSLTLVFKCLNVVLLQYLSRQSTLLSSQFFKGISCVLVLHFPQYFTEASLIKITNDQNCPLFI